MKNDNRMKNLGTLRKILFIVWLALSALSVIVLNFRYTFKQSVLLVCAVSFGMILPVLPVVHFIIRLIRDIHVIRNGTKSEGVFVRYIKGNELRFGQAEVEICSGAGAGRRVRFDANPLFYAEGARVSVYTLDWTEHNLGARTIFRDLGYLLTFSALCGFIIFGASFWPQQIIEFL